MASAPLRILILEDVPMDAELVEYELRRTHIPFDARCVDTRDGFERELHEFRPDLILSDYSVPILTACLRCPWPGSERPVRLLIVTGSVNEETAVGCMKAGATDYLLKTTWPGSGPPSRARWPGSSSGRKNRDPRPPSTGPRPTCGRSSTTASSALS